MAEPDNNTDSIYKQINYIEKKINTDSDGKSPLLITIEEPQKARKTHERNTRYILWRIIKMQPQKMYVILASMCSLIFGISMLAISILLGQALGSFSEPDTQKLLIKIDSICFAYLICGVFISLAGTFKVILNIISILIDYNY